MTMRIEISAVGDADVEAIATLARVAWQDVYPAIITQAQIDHMLGERYNVSRLRGELATPGIWWDQIHVDGYLAGFASSLLTANPGEMKLDKLYVNPVWQRFGLGGRLIAHVVERALDNACGALILAVNKRNDRAIAAYKKHGFVVREAVCVDIGNGFAMDDFIMARELTRPGSSEPETPSEGSAAA